MPDPPNRKRRKEDEMVDLGRMLQQIGAGIEQKVVVEIITRNADDVMIHKIHVPLKRASLVGGEVVRLIVEQRDIDNATPFTGDTD